MYASASLVNQHALAQEGRKPDPDALLIEVYKDMAANHLREALQKTDRLIEAYPNFHLAHLIRGDLLMMHGRPVTTLGAASNAPADKLKDFRDEAMVRLRSLRERPDPDLVPNSVLMLRDDQSYVLLADTKQSRLYVYQHDNGQLKFVTDYYITQGKLGINKVKEGDQKTPIGVYYITSRLPKAKLPDFYGAGALPINYPNEWDKLNGRSGSGIWLHGTPSDSFSRPPLASDGCVVLTNPDLEKLSLSVEIGKTPIVISDQVEFISRGKWDAERNASAQMMDGWRRDLESMDSERVLNNYSKKFKSNLGEDLLRWFPKYRIFLQGKVRPAIKLRDMTLFRYPGRDEMVVSTFTQETVIGKSKAAIRKRQYWAKEGAQWKIIYEGTL
ncbi:MAG: L,D-transpeptidase family protein [Pseudomonadota bacterium]